MNKQELIESLAKRISPLEDFRGISGFHDGNYEGLEYALNLIQQLDEPQKLILPKCAEQWIEGHCAPSDVVNLFIEVTCATDSDGFIDSKWRWSTDFYEWLANDADTLYILCDALRYGYEVEKGPLYHVLLPDKGATNTGYTFLNLAGAIDFTTCKEKVDMLTEQEIKAVDERYWPFAVKVEDE